MAVCSVSLPSGAVYWSAVCDCGMIVRPTVSSDEQPGLWSYWLIWVFAGCTIQFVDFGKISYNVRLAQSVEHQTFRAYTFSGVWYLRVVGSCRVILAWSFIYVPTLRVQAVIALTSIRCSHMRKSSKSYFLISDNRQSSDICSFYIRLHSRRHRLWIVRLQRMWLKNMVVNLRIRDKTTSKQSDVSGSSSVPRYQCNNFRICFDYFLLLWIRFCENQWWQKTENSYSNSSSVKFT